MSFTSNIQINNYYSSTTSDGIYEYLSQIHWTYDLTDNSGNTITESVVSTFNEINGYVYNTDSTITNQSLIDFLTQQGFTQPTQEKLISKLNKLSNPRTYRWYIYEMSVMPNFEGYENFVSIITWRYNCISDLGYEANLLGQTRYNSIEDHPYIGYYDLTENEVNSWLDGQPNLLDLQYNLDKQIDEQMNPPVVTLPIPWE